MLILAVSWHGHPCATDDEDAVSRRRVPIGQHHVLKRVRPSKDAGFDIESLDLQLPALRPSARGTKQVEASRSAVDGQRHVRGIPCD